MNPEMIEKEIVAYLKKCEMEDTPYNPLEVLLDNLLATYRDGKMTAFRFCHSYLALRIANCPEVA